MKQDAATVRTVAQAVDHVIDLVNAAAVPGRPGPPLPAVHGAEVTAFRGPFVPDADTVLLQPGHVGIPVQEPDELIDDALQVQLLGGQQRKPVIEVAAELPPEHRQGAGAGAVVLAHAVVEDIPEKIQVLLHDQAPWARDAPRR